MWNSTVFTQQQDKKKSNIQITECSFLMYFLLENLTTMPSYMCVCVYIYIYIYIHTYMCVCVYIYIYICTYIHMYLIIVTWVKIYEKIRKLSIISLFGFFFFLAQILWNGYRRSWWFSQLVMLEFPPTEGKETPPFWIWKSNIL